MTDEETLRQLQKAREKKPPKTKKPIRKVSAKKAAQQKEEKILFELDKSFYAEHWAACPHKCEACGRNLGKEPLTTFFHHALPKGQARFEAFRHVHENIIVLCPDCHTQAETFMDAIPYVKKRTEEIYKLLMQ